MSKHNFILLMLVLSSVSFGSQLLAQAPMDLFESGNQAFKDKNYAKAIEDYERIDQEGYRSFDLYYNLGVAYFQQGDLGPSRYYLEKARLLRPGNADLKHNLEVARATMVDQFPPRNTFFLARIWRGIRGLFSANVWTVLFIIILVEFAVFWGIWFFGKTRRARKRGFYLGLVSILLAFLPLLFAIQEQSKLEGTGFGVVLENIQPLYGAPDATSVEKRNIHAGLKVELLDKIEDFYKVELINGEQGWVPVTSLGLL